MSRCVFDHYEFRPYRPVTPSPRPRGYLFAAAQQPASSDPDIFRYGSILGRGRLHLVEEHGALTLCGKKATARIRFYTPDSMSEVCVDCRKLADMKLAVPLTDRALIDG